MMMETDMTVAITRTEHTAADLRRLTGGSDDAAVARRLLALALILDGHKRGRGAARRPCRMATRLLQLRFAHTSMRPRHLKAEAAAQASFRAGPALLGSSHGFLKNAR